MSLFDRFRRGKKSTPEEPEESFSAQCLRYGYNPEASRIILEYLRRLRKGEPSDPVFEQKSLGGDLNFTSLNFAEILFAISKEHEIPVERIAHFNSIGIPGGGDPGIANILRRIEILVERGLEESTAAYLHAAGYVGDPTTEIYPFGPEFDNVAFVVKMCNVTISLKDNEEFDIRDGGYGDVEEDPGWG